MIIEIFTTDNYQEGTMKEKVALAACQTYSQVEVEKAVAELLAAWGGVSALVSPGETVLLKPNIVEGLPPERAVTTHPEIVRAVIRQVKQAGAKPVVGESPGVSGTRKAAERCGIWAVCQEEGVELLLFEEATSVAFPDGKMIKKFSLAKDLYSVDKVISLAKMKTHTFMDITGGVKNLFGLIVGADKAQFHLRLKRRSEFAAMLVDLNQLVAPIFYLVDGVVGMEGNGPRNGIPKQAGLLLGGTNGFAVDMVMADVMDFPAEKLPVAAEALRQGLTAGLSAIERTGSARDVKVPFVRPRNLESLDGRLPSWFVSFGQQQLTARPAIESNCVGCSRCVKHCPPQAMVIKEGKAVIDYSRCIRCYCCQELCPHNAVSLREGFLLRGVRRGIRWLR
jgi:uncharacterized protein (DUF362 family)/Pyruvate/2-oxoacid:ferredoxin oxidoreductase delta subunit